METSTQLVQLRRTPTRRFGTPQSLPLFDAATLRLTRGPHHGLPRNIFCRTHVTLTCVHGFLDTNDTMTHGTPRPLGCCHVAQQKTWWFMAPRGAVRSDVVRTPRTWGAVYVGGTLYHLVLHDTTLDSNQEPERFVSIQWVTIISQSVRTSTDLGLECRALPAWLLRSPLSPHRLPLRRWSRVTSQ